MVYFLQSEPRAWYLVGTAPMVAAWIDGQWSCAGRIDRRNRKARRTRRESPYQVVAMFEGDQEDIRRFRETFSRWCRGRYVPEKVAFWVEPAPEIAAFLAEYGSPWDGEDAALLGVKSPERPKVDQDTPKPHVDIRARLARRHE